MTGVQQAFPGFGVALDEKVERAVEVLRMYEPAALKHDPDNGYWGAFSGGKDSVCIKELAAMAGVRVAWHYNVTTIDPPELHRFIRRHHPDVTWERPKRHFFAILAYDRGYPVRHQRWCCQEFKEGYGHRQVKIMGVRWAESPRRRQLWKTFQRWDPTRSHGNAGPGPGRRRRRDVRRDRHGGAGAEERGRGAVRGAGRQDLRVSEHDRTERARPVRPGHDAGDGLALRLARRPPRDLPQRVQAAQRLVEAHPFRLGLQPHPGRQAPRVIGLPVLRTGGRRGEVGSAVESGAGGRHTPSRSRMAPAVDPQPAAPVAMRCGARRIDSAGLGPGDGPSPTTGAHEAPPRRRASPDLLTVRWAALRIPSGR